MAGPVLRQSVHGRSIGINEAFEEASQQASEMLRAAATQHSLVVRACRHVLQHAVARMHQSQLLRCQRASSQQATPRMTSNQIKPTAAAAAAAAAHFVWILRQHFGAELHSDRAAADNDQRLRLAERHRCSCSCSYSSGASERASGAARPGTSPV